MPIQFFSSKPQFRVEVFRICRCQSEWYFRWPSQADKWGKDRRWVIRKWFIIWCCLNAVVLYSLHCCFVLFCCVLNFLFCFFSSIARSSDGFICVNLVLIVWWSSVGPSMLFDMATRSPSSSAVIWIISLKTDFCCGKAGWKLFTSVWQLSWLVSSISCLQLFAALGASMLQRIHNEALWKEWFCRRVIIFGNVVEIVWSFNLRFIHRDKVACARNVRIRTTAAAGSAREFGLKDCEIGFATMLSPSRLLWRVCVYDFTVPQGV